MTEIESLSRKLKAANKTIAAQVKEIALRTKNLRLSAGNAANAANAILAVNGSSTRLSADDFLDDEFKASSQRPGKYHPWSRPLSR